MSLLPGDDHHTHVTYSDAYGASATQESFQALADRVDRLEELVTTLADASHENAIKIDHLIKHTVKQ